MDNPMGALPGPVYGRFGITVYPGDCRDVLPALPDNSMDAVVTDPPYELGFMGKGWDSTGVAYDVDVWRQCLRVLKPGGHLLAFGGTRTWHRLVCAVEDAGFEIRDSIAWLYATGFPKSLDVSKAIDKRGGNPHLAAEVGAAIKEARESRSWTIGQADRHFCDGSTNWTWYEGRKGVCRPPTLADFVRIAEEWPELAPWAGKVSEAEREVIGQRRTSIDRGWREMEGRDDKLADVHDVTAPATPAAEQWQGWGTALKPAFEPIVVARKPLAGTVAANVLEYDTGALNIDGCRVVTSDVLHGSGRKPLSFGGDNHRPYHDREARPSVQHDAGRWPTNVVLTHAATPDGVDLCGNGCVPGCVVADLDEQSGVRKSGSPKTGREPTAAAYSGEIYGAAARLGVAFDGYGDTGGASRFFPVFRFEAKAPGSERPRVDGVAHPTVKPLALLRWLVRLVTPPRGTVLDPFAGTGVTGQACRAENMACTLIERDKASIPLIRARLDRRAGSTAKPSTASRSTPVAQFDLFDTGGL